jgi:hypothetical protein
MANKKNWFGILVMVLVFGMAVVGCDNDPVNGGGDTWSNVTSLSQLNGTWKGSYSFTETEDGITVKTTTEMTLNINASAKTESGTMKTTMAFSGAGITESWSGIKETFEETFKETGVSVTFNDSNHSMSMTVTFSDKFDDNDIAEMLASGIQINQNGTKVKQPAGDGMPEIIMTKQ